MFKATKVFTVIALFMICKYSNAQNLSFCQEYEAELVRLFSEMAQSKSDIVKENHCEVIAGKFDTLLVSSLSFDYPFDSLKNLGKIYSPDRNIRFYTWNLPYNDGSNRYFGFIQFKTKKDRDPVVFRLTDCSNSLENPEHAILDRGNWYGSLVYEIIEQSDDGIKYYILLGYDPHDLFLSRKIIDVLYFNKGNKPVFGHPVFLLNKTTQSRILFEYSAKVRMTLQWNPSMKMIVFDHLSPESSTYKDNPQFYGPDFSYDGFQFKNGYWNLISDLDIRNVRK